jgi:pyrophosphatase PpaX
MREYDAYLFDADGTIIDTREMIYHSYIRMAEVLGIEPPARELVMNTTGLPVRRQIRELLGWDHDDAYYDRAATAYGDHIMELYPTHLRAFPGVKEGLERLWKAGKRLAVVTSRRRHSLDLFLGKLDLAKYFHALVTPDDTDEHKPSPEPALLAMRLIEADPRRTVFVGDAEFDIQCGKAAGTAAAFVSWAGIEYKNWPVQPDFVADTFQDLLPEN